MRLKLCLFVSAAAANPLFTETSLGRGSFGAEIHGISIAERFGTDESGSRAPEEETVRLMQDMKEALHRNRLLIFRKQGAIDWRAQVNFSAYFGEGRMAFDSLRQR